MKTKASHQHTMLLSQNCIQKKKNKTKMSIKESFWRGAQQHIDGRIYWVNSSKKWVESCRE
jgi:hypothetical protein